MSVCYFKWKQQTLPEEIAKKLKSDFFYFRVNTQKFAHRGK